jgi:hypothetical protein
LTNCYPQDNGAISSINLLKNRIPVEQAQEFVQIMQTNEKLVTLCGLSKEETKLDFSGQDLNAGDAVLIANDISNMGALLVLSLESNWLYAAGGKALAEGLKCNQVIKELNIASNKLGMNSNGNSDMSGVTALGDVIPDMGALTKLILKDNAMLTKAAGKALASALAGNPVLTELDISDQAGYRHDDGPGFAKELAAGISDNGALSALNLSQNMLCDEGAKIIANVITSTAISSLDMSANNIGVMDPVLAMLERNEKMWELILDNNPGFDGDFWSQWEKCDGQASKEWERVKLVCRWLLFRQQQNPRHPSCHFLHGHASWPIANSLPSPAGQFGFAPLWKLLHDLVSLPGIQYDSLVRWSILLLCLGAVFFPLVISPADEDVSAAGGLTNTCNTTTCTIIVANTKMSASTSEKLRPPFIHVALSGICNASSLPEVETLVQDFVDPVSGFLLVIVAALIWLVCSTRIGNHSVSSASSTALQLLFGCCVGSSENDDTQLKQYLATNLLELIQEEPHLLRIIKEGHQEASAEEVTTAAMVTWVGQRQQEGKVLLQELMEEDMKQHARSKPDRAFYLLVHLLSVCCALGQHLLWTDRRPTGSLLCTVAARGTLAIFYKPILPSMWYGLAHLMDQEGWMLHHNLTTDTIVLFIWMMFACWFAVALAVSGPLVCGCFFYLGGGVAVPFCVFRWLKHELLLIARVHDQGDRYFRQEAKKAKYGGLDKYQSPISDGARQQKAREKYEEMLEAREKGEGVGSTKKLYDTAVFAAVLHNRLLSYSIIAALVFGILLWPFYLEPGRYTRILRNAVAAMAPGIVPVFDLSFLNGLFRWPSGMDVPSKLSLVISLGALLAENLIWLWRYMYARVIRRGFSANSATRRADTSLSEALRRCAQIIAESEEQDEDDNGENTGAPSDEVAAICDDQWRKHQQELHRMSVALEQGKQEIAELRDRLSSPRAAAREVEEKPAEGGGAVSMWSSVIRKHDGEQDDTEPSPTKRGDEELHDFAHARKSLKSGVYSNRASIMAEQERMSAAEAAVLAEARPDGADIPSESAGIEWEQVPGMVDRAANPLVQRKLEDLEVVVEDPQSVEEEGINLDAAGINAEEELQRSRIIV